MVPQLFILFVKTQRHNNQLPVTKEKKLVFSLCSEWTALQYLNLNWTVILKRCAPSQCCEALVCCRRPLFPPLFSLVT